MRTPTAPIQRTTPRRLVGSRSGQALVELAVIGSLVLLVLGTMLNYGLNADFHQQATMRAFREVLAIEGVETIPASFASAMVDNSPIPTSTTGGASYTIVEDRFIPNPSDPFATGSHLPVAVSDNVLRDMRLHATAGPNLNDPIGLGMGIVNLLASEAEVPRTHFRLNGENIDCPSLNLPFDRSCTTANIRLGGGAGARITEIYGGGNVSLLEIPLLGDIPFLGDALDLGVGFIIDPCMGEIIDYDGCKRIARQLVDPLACIQECNRARSWMQWIDALVQQNLNLLPPPCEVICFLPVDIPWYAQGATQSGGEWFFPNLDSLFVDTRTLGLQPGSSTTTQLDNSLHVQNTPGGAKTTSSVNWDTDVTRTIKYQSAPFGGAFGSTVNELTPSTDAKSEHTDTTWITAWE